MIEAARIQQTVDRIQNESTKQKNQSPRLNSPSEFNGAGRINKMFALHVSKHNYPDNPVNPV